MSIRYTGDIEEQNTAHTPPREDGGHPEGCKMYAKISAAIYWPSLALDRYATVRQCTKCARERAKLRKHSKTMKPSPATEPLEFVAIDILSE